MRIGSEILGFSFGAGPCRTGHMAHLVTPAQEAGRADQIGRHRSSDAWEPMGPIPFAEHLTKSNRFAREADHAPRPFTKPFSLSVPCPTSSPCSPAPIPLCRPQLEKAKTHPLATAGNDRCGDQAKPAPCPRRASTPKALHPNQIALVLLAYQIRHPVSLGRLMDVVL